MLVSLHSPQGADALKELQGELESGRTSLVQKPEIADTYYQLMGFRAFGPQAIRVDILERLADLIRPALSWRPEHEGERPEGAEDRGFRATPGMMSLLGCSEENLRTILSALGYRKGSRPLNEEEAAAWDERIAARKAKNPEDTLAKPETIETWHVPKKSTGHSHTQGRDQGQAQTQDGDAGAQHKPRQQRHKSFKQAGDFAKGKGPKHGSNSHNAPATPPKREKPVDQDSPFAALAQLKSQMQSKKK
jgi:ATP-dependent RNA helicase SUPV3L1/SUV3